MSHQRPQTGLEIVFRKSGSRYFSRSLIFEHLHADCNTGSTGLQKPFIFQEEAADTPDAWQDKRRWQKKPSDQTCSANETISHFALGNFYKKVLGWQSFDDARYGVGQPPTNRWKRHAEHADTTQDPALSEKAEGNRRPG
nr:hypothetical protein [uncultured Roseibium sp.]